jgi:hypothetical protein
VARLTDPEGVGIYLYTWGQFFLPAYISPPRTDLEEVPFDFKLWFDGTKVHFSAETELSTGEIIKSESTYTPVGKILSPKTPPFRRLETMIDMSYPDYPNPADQSYIQNEWDNVRVPVEATNLGAVKQIIKNASKKR